MPRHRTIPDEALLDAALDIVHGNGPGALSFGALATATGLASSTLVQRFGTKAALLRAALLRAWDRLDQTTAAAITAAPGGVDGVVELFVELTASHDENDYTDQLPVLREDLRDPILRRRGERWLATLVDAVDSRLDGTAPGMGHLVIAQWQGTLTVWAFTRRGRLEHAVRNALEQLLHRTAAS